MSTRVINAQKEVARVVASFFSEGHMLYARYDYTDKVMLFFRHRNGKKHQITITNDYVTIIRNGRFLSRQHRAQGISRAHAQHSSFPAT